MTVRKTVRALARDLKTSKAQHPGVPVGDLVSLKATAIGKAGDPRFSLVASFMLNDVKTDIEVADDSGKVRYFPTVESALRTFAGPGEASDGVYNVTVDTGVLYASKVASDIYTAAESRVIKLAKAKTAQQAKAAAGEALLNGPMAGWNVGNAAQQAKWNETSAQVTVLYADIAAIDTEVVELRALIASKP